MCKNLVVLVQLAQGACAESGFYSYLVTALAPGLRVKKGLELSGGVEQGWGGGGGRELGRGGLRGLGQAGGVCGLSDRERLRLPVPSRARV